jgi:hypothetical protein
MLSFQYVEVLSLAQAQTQYETSNSPRVFELWSCYCRYVIDGKHNNHIFVTLTSNVAPVCTGASGNLDEAIRLTQEVPALSTSSHQRSTQLDTFILRRTNRFPEERDSKNFDQAYCRLLAFELLFLWNALPSCSVQHINNLLEGTALLHVFQTYNKHSTIHRYM